MIRAAVLVFFVGLALLGASWWSAESAESEDEALGSLIPLGLGVACILVAVLMLLGHAVYVGLFT